MKDIWSWADGGVIHCCQVVGGLSICSALNTLKDSIETFANEPVVVVVVIVVSLDDWVVDDVREDAAFSSNFIQ